MNHMQPKDKTEKGVHYVVILQCVLTKNTQKTKK